MSITHFKNNTIGDFTGTVTVFNSLGNTVTANATDLVRPSDWNSNHNIVFNLSGNTAGSSQLSGADIIFVGGNNITLSADTANSKMVISAPNTAAQSQQPMYYSAANGNTSSGTIQFANSNGVSFSTGTQGVYATVATNYQSQGAYLTTARASNDAIGLNSALTANGVSVTANSSGLSLNFPAFLTTADLSQNSSKYAGINAAITGGSITVNTSGVSVNLPAYLTTAMQSNAATISNINMSAGTTSTNASAFTFSNLNGVTFGLGTGANAGIMTASVAAAGGAQTGISGVSAGTQLQTVGTLQFVNSNGITFGMSNSSQLTASYTVPTQTNQTGNLYVTANSTQLSSTAGIDLRSLSFAGAGVASVGVSQGVIVVSVPAGGGGGIANAAGTQTATSGTVVFSNSNNFTFGMSNSSVVTASFSESTHAHTWNQIAAGTQTGANSSTVMFSNSNGITFGMSNSSVVTASYNSTQFAGVGSAITNGAMTFNTAGLSLNLTQLAGTSTGFTGANISGSMTHNSAGLALSMSVAAPGGGGAINVSAGTTSGNLQTLQFADSNGVSWGLNGSTVTASVNAGGGAAATMSGWRPNQLVNTTLSSYGQNTLNFIGFDVPTNVSATAIEMIWSFSNATSSISHAVSHTISYAMYSHGTGASSANIMFISSSSMSMGASYSSNLSGGYTIAQGTNSTTYSSAGVGSTTAWSGLKVVDLPFNTVMAAGNELFFGIAQSSASVGNTGGLRISMLAVSKISNISFGQLQMNGISGTSASVVQDRMGFVQTVTSNAWPASINFSNISQNVSGNAPYIFYDAISP